MKINQAFKLSLGLVAAGVFASAAQGQEVAAEKKASAQPFVKAYSEVQMRLFNTYSYSKADKEELQELNPYQVIRPLVGAKVLDGNADVSLRTSLKKYTNSVQVEQLQSIANVTINNVGVGPLSVTPYLEHFLAGAGNPASTEFYLDNILSQKLETGVGALTLAGEVELMTVLGGKNPADNVKDERVELGLVSKDESVKSTTAKDAKFQHEWNVGAMFTPAAAKGFTVGVQQFVTNSYAPVYTVNAQSVMSEDASYPLSQTGWERLTLAYTFNEKFTLLNFTDFTQTGFYQGAAAAGTPAVQNQMRLIYTLF